MTGDALRGFVALDARAARLLVADYALRILPLFERRHPGEHRPRIAIAVARRFAAGGADAAELAAAKEGARLEAAASTSRPPDWAAAMCASRAADRTVTGHGVATALLNVAKAFPPDRWDVVEADEREWVRDRLDRYLRGETPPPVEPIATAEAVLP